MSATVTFYGVRMDGDYRYLDLDLDKGGRWSLGGHGDAPQIDGRTWGDAWDPPPIRGHVPSDYPEADFCGITHISEGAFAVRPEAMSDDLEVFLGLVGELLPLPCGEREYTLVNITEVVDALDWENTIMRRDGIAGAGFPKGFNIDRPRFHVERLGGQLFKIPEHAASAIYYWERSNDDPNEQFRRFYQSRELTGLRFEPIYSETVPGEAET